MLKPKLGIQKVSEENDYSMNAPSHEQQLLKSLNYLIFQKDYHIRL